MPAEARQSRHRPGDGRVFVFQPDQEMDRVDFVNLAARLRQNTVQQKLANL
jgi:hypothetical protein